MLTLIADHNIAHLHDYFNEAMLGQPVKLIALAGREITAEVINEYQPDALLIRSVTIIDETLLSGNNSVKFVGSATIGTDHVDQAYLSKRQIAFADAAGCSKHSVAQYVITAILTLRPQYWQASNNQMPSQNQPVKLGIIGLGNIGSTLAQYAVELGWQVLGYDPLLPASTVNNASLYEVLTQSDAISLHVPLTNNDSASAVFSDYPTYHLIDETALAKMPADTLLINSARGPVISEAALLADVVQTQRKVVLDVFEHEPIVSSQLLNHLSIATPHIAGYTLEGKLRGTQMVFDQFIKVFERACPKASTEAITKDNSGANNETSRPLMQDLLPLNPYQWSTLNAHPNKLSQYYDIKADDLLLRQALPTGAAQVSGQAFDQLRKDYILRREWQMAGY